MAAFVIEHPGWTVAAGRAYPVEAGVPYAIFSDALVPLLRELGSSSLTVLARGAEAQRSPAELAREALAYEQVLTKAQQRALWPSVRGHMPQLDDDSHPEPSAGASSRERPLRADALRARPETNP